MKEQAGGRSVTDGRTDGQSGTWTMHSVGRIADAPPLRNKHGRLVRLNIHCTNALRCHYLCCERLSIGTRCIALSCQRLSIGTRCIALCKSRVLSR